MKGWPLKLKVGLYCATLTVLALVASAAIILPLIYHRQVEELERLARLRRFLAPQLAELIASDQHEQALESHRREVTVVFCDLRGFTAFSETTEPEEVMRVLREFHVTMGELIHQYEGTLERFAGHDDLFQ